MHNGYVREFPNVRRDLLLAVDPALFPNIEGSGDSEVLFHLALTFGLENDPLTAIERHGGLRRGGRRAPRSPESAEDDSRDERRERIIAARYSSDGQPGSLYVSADARALKAQHPDIEEIQWLSNETRAIVSEPLGDVVGAWNELPKSSIGVVKPGQDELYVFTPRRPGGDASSPKERASLLPS